MRLTTELRETPAGVFTPAKHWNLCCHVEFSHEERAIIEARGLHELFLQLPTAAPPPGELAYIGIKFIRPGANLLLIIAGVLIFIGFFPDVRGLQTLGTWLLFIGIGVWLFSWWKEHEARKRLWATEQQVSLGQLLSDPDFSVYAYTRDGAERDEGIVRDQLANLSARIKASAELRPQRTYEL